MTGQERMYSLSPNTSSSWRPSCGGGEKIKRSVADIIASKQSGNPVKIGKLTLLVKQGALE